MVAAPVGPAIGTRSTTQAIVTTPATSLMCLSSCFMTAPLVVFIHTPSNSSSLFPEELFPIYGLIPPLLMPFHIVQRGRGDLIAEVPNRIGGGGGDVPFTTFQHVHEAIHRQVSTLPVAAVVEATYQGDLAEIGIERFRLAFGRGHPVLHDDEPGQLLLPAFGAGVHGHQRIDPPCDINMPVHPPLRAGVLGDGGPWDQRHEEHAQGYDDRLSRDDDLFHDSSPLVRFVVGRQQRFVCRQQSHALPPTVVRAPPGSYSARPHRPRAAGRRTDRSALPTQPFPVHGFTV